MLTLINKLSVLVLGFGYFGACYNSGNLVLYYMALELLLLGVNVLFMMAALNLGDIHGMIVSFYILTASASEMAMGLGLLVSYYISQMDISVNFMSLLSW